VIAAFIRVKIENVDSILSSGFISSGMAATSGSKFEFPLLLSHFLEHGNGVYLSPQAAYSIRELGTGVAILCLVSYGSPFPVISGDEEILTSKGPFQEHDLHYSPLLPTDAEADYCYRYRSMESEEEIPVFDEIVCFDDAQISPQFLVYFTSPQARQEK